MEYSLGNTEAEHRRLAKQAERFDPLTERLFRAAGIGPGQRVLDLGSGAGDVSMLLSRIVGASGEVVGIERDAGSIGWARKRVRDAGIENVQFVQSEIDRIPDMERFDAAVGRFILMFVPDPVEALRNVRRLVRDGGAIAFQEPWWRPYLAGFPDLPLWSAALRLIQQTFERTGARTEQGIELADAFRRAGLGTPSMHLEMLIGDEEWTTLWASDVLASLMPQVRRFGLSTEGVGDMTTLPSRIHEEVKRSGSVVGGPPVIGAWART